MESNKRLARTFMRSHKDAMNALVSNSVNMPVGPSGPLRQVYPVVPTFTAAFLNTQRNMRDGRGVIVPVGVSAPVTHGTPVLVTHNLGRIPSGVVGIVNNGGATEPPLLTMTGQTRISATITGDKDMTNCFVRFE